MPALSALSPMRRLQAWLTREGANFPGMKILDQGPGQRLAVARRHLPAGSLVLHLPRALLMDVATARISRTGQALLARYPDASDTALLVAQLLDLQRHGGKWTRYGQTLPDSFPEHPLFYTQAQLQELQGSYAVRVIERHRARQAREYRHLRESLAEGQGFAQAAHAWAWATVLTRRFDVRLDGIKTMAMIPFADMPDHAPQPNLQWSSESSRGFFLTAAQDIESGTPLTIRYWKHCNGLTLATYGFSLDENPHNVAELRFPEVSGVEGTSSGPTLEAGDVRDGQRVFRVPAGAQDARTREMLGYLLRTAGHPDNALAQLRTACEQRLSEFATTVEEDRRLLDNPELPLWKRFSVRVRHDEKLILHSLGSLTPNEMATALRGARPE